MPIMTFGGESLVNTDEQSGKIIDDGIVERGVFNVCLVNWLKY